jgi:hypothetical protein
MAELDLRSIEPLATVLLVSLHSKNERAKRRKQCLIALEVTGLTTPRDAQSVEGSSVSSAIIRGERRFAPGSATIVSRYAAKVTTTG